MIFTVSLPHYDHNASDVLEVPVLNLLGWGGSFFPEHYNFPPNVSCACMYTVISIIQQMWGYKNSESDITFPTPQKKSFR